MSGMTLFRYTEPQNNLQRIVGGAKKVGWFGLVGGFMYFARDDQSLMHDIWNAAKTASPFAAMWAILLFIDERAERREAQRQCNERTIDFIQTNHVASAALDKNSAANDKLGQAVRELATVVGANTNSAVIPPRRSRTNA